MIIQGSDVRQFLPQFLEHFEALTCDDRYNRFFHTMSPEAIRDWLLSIEGRGNEKHLFIVVIDESDAYLHGRFVGIAQIAIHTDTMDGDVAVSVIPEFQKRGIGTQMLQESIRMAREAKLHSLHFNCEMQNHKCRDLYTKMGFISAYNPAEYCICGTLQLGE
jgi:GNAT superfamily N-acetyltransferase